MDDMRTRAIEPYTTADGDARFKVRFWLPDDTAPRGRRQSSKTFTDERGAREFSQLIDVVGPARATTILDERLAAPATVMTLTAFARHHVDQLTGVGDDYRRRCRSVIDRDLADLGPLPITAIDGGAVERWVNQLEAAGQSGKTIRNKHGFLAAVMRRAVAKRIIPANPCEGVRLPKTVSVKPTFLTPEEYTRFIAYFTPTWQPFVAALFGTGARFSELTALTVGDVDLAQGAVHITKAWKDNGHHVGAPKSEKSVRTLAIAPETVALLRPFAEGRPADALLFRNTHGGPVRLQTFHDNVWGPAVRLANGLPARQGKRVGRRRDADGREITPAAIPLGKRPRVHDARHSCASWLLAAGAPLNVVQDHMGHESIVTTTKTYGHLLPSARLAVSAALSLALTAAHPQIEA